MSTSIFPLSADDIAFLETRKDFVRGSVSETEVAQALAWHRATRGTTERTPERTLQTDLFPLSGADVAHLERQARYASYPISEEAVLGSLRDAGLRGYPTEGTTEFPDYDDEAEFEPSVDFTPSIPYSQRLTAEQVRRAALFLACVAHRDGEVTVSEIVTEIS